MELHSDIVTGLETLSSLSNVFESIVDTSFDILFQKKDELSFESNEYSSVDSLTLKKAHSGLTGFILEGGKRKADPILMRGVLSDYIKNTSNIDYFIEKYTKVSKELFAYLSTTGFNFPHIVDVNWRLSFHMKSQNLEKENKPLYLVRFDTKKPSPTPLQNDKTSPVEFTCNGWELLDLVQKLKDAAKQFDRVNA